MLFSEGKEKYNGAVLHYIISAVKTKKNIIIKRINKDMSVGHSLKGFIRVSIGT